MVSARLDSLYVAWSASRQMSKIGISFAPHARISQLRREKADSSISLMSAWNILSCGELVSAGMLEFRIHQALRTAGFADPATDFATEWFTVRWPTAAAIVDQCAQLWSPIGVRLQQMQGVHGK